jgi:hypothetical protein
MKKISFYAFALLWSLQLNAQAPQKMSYQSVVRNNAGQLIVSANVGVQISILQGTSNGIAVYIERHTVPTNANGLATLEIGGGTIIAGSFGTIDWANGPYFLKTETDPNGGTTYSISGTSQLLSVPYALYAATAGNAGGGSGSTLDQAYDQGGPGAGRTITSDAGAVQINNSGTNTIGLEVNSAVNNSTAILTNVSGTGVGFRAESTSPANTFAAIQANTNSSAISNSAILGNNTGAGYGVSGQIPQSATGAAAVYGSNLRTTGGSGVNGIGFNGVVGQSNYGNGFAVYGSNTGAGGLGIGTYGIGFNGIYGQTTNTVTGWAGYFTADIGVDGAGFALGGWINASDRRLKSNIEPIGNALQKISLLDGKNYILTTKTKDLDGTIHERSRPQFGLIAQDLELVFPEMVQEKALFINAGDETLYKTVDYIQLIPILVEAVKELKQEIDTLNKELETLRKSND